MSIMLVEEDVNVADQGFRHHTPCANCMRAEKQALKAAEQFSEQVEVVHLDALEPEAQAYGLMVTPMVVVGEEVVGTSKVVPAARLVPIIQKHLGGKYYGATGNL